MRPAASAGWGELFFQLDGHELPERPDFYLDGVAAGCELSGAALAAKVSDASTALRVMGPARGSAHGETSDDSDGSEEASSSEEEEEEEDEPSEQSDDESDGSLLLGVADRDVDGELDESDPSEPQPEERRRLLDAEPMSEEDEEVSDYYVVGV